MVTDVDLVESGWRWINIKLSLPKAKVRWVSICKDAKGIG